MKLLSLRNGKNSLTREVNYEVKEYCTLDYNRTKDTAGVMVVAQLLKNVDDAIIQQHALASDIPLLAEKALSKINIRDILIYKKSSYQLLNQEYFETICTNGIWEMLQDKFIDFKPMVTRDLFMKVAFACVDPLKELAKKEEGFVESVLKKCISQREDGRIEITFPGELWGNDELVSRMIQNAENAGICFVDIPASPVSKKAILPYGWLIGDAEYGYISLVDTNYRKRGVFRVKELPSKFNNGEVDFFFDIPGIEKGEIVKALEMPKNERKFLKDSNLRKFLENL